MTFTLKKIAVALTAASALLLAACGPAAQDEHHIKVGISAGIDQSLWAVVQKVAKQKYDLDVEVVTFNDYVLPNEALNNGDLDINAFQHKPYLDKQMQERGYKLAAVGNTFVYPIAGYSKKIASLSQLPDGAQVAVPNDPTNLGRSLLLLQKQGLITLKDGVGLLPTALDIVSNPKKLKIVEIEAPQLPRALDDAQLAIINGNYALQAGLVPSKDALALEQAKDNPYANVLVTTPKLAHDPRILELAKDLESKQTAEFINQHYKGSVIPVNQ